jgi:hypothetical protein
MKSFSEHKRALERAIDEYRGLIECTMGHELNSSQNSGVLEQLLSQGEIVRQLQVKLKAARIEEYYYDDWKLEDARIEKYYDNSGD